MNNIFNATELESLLKRRFHPDLLGWGPKEAQGAILFGAGGAGRFFLSFMRAAGVEPYAFVDNLKSLWGSFIEGVQVLPPTELTKVKERKVILCTAFCLREQIAQCRQIGVQSFTPYFNFCRKPFPFVVATDEEAELILSSPDVLKGYSIWSDDVSRKIYKGTLAFRLTQDIHDMPSYTKGEYFLPEFFQKSDYIRFVDGGAFNGDTLKELIKFTGSEIEFYHGFEPDPSNFLALENTKTSLAESLHRRVHLHPLAMGASSGAVYFQSWGNACSAIGLDGPLCVAMDSLDSVLDETENPSFIKLDVEGAEPEALAGMEKTIRRCRPAMAVCVYHKVDHLWTLPLWIANLNLGYRLFLRKHSESYSETVCYAVP